MSDFTLRMGAILHLHRYVQRPRSTESTPLQFCVDRTVPRPRSGNPDELAFFGLCLGSPRANPSVELERLSLVNHDDSTPYGLTASWRCLL